MTETLPSLPEHLMGRYRAAQDFISARLPIAAVASIPEIRLHMAGPQSGLSRLAEKDPGFGSPYWARCWGGGLALGRYILDNPESVAGRRVLDLGAGSGIVGIAAAKAGATDVIAADIDLYAVAAMTLNATINGVTLLPRIEDLTEGEPPPVDIVCVGDLFYDPALAARVTAFLDRCMDRGMVVLIGDPWRAYLPSSRLKLLTEYPVSDFGDAIGGTRPSAVFALKAAIR